MYNHSSHNKEIGEWHNLQKIQLESAKSVMKKKSFGRNDETTEGLNMAQTLVVLLLPPKPLGKLSR